MTSFPLYPAVLRHIADLCEGLDKVSGPDQAEGVFLQNGISVMDAEDVQYGIVKDDGAGWCFYPASEEAA